MFRFDFIPQGKLTYYINICERIYWQSISIIFRCCCFFFYSYFLIFRSLHLFFNSFFVVLFWYRDSKYAWCGIFQRCSSDLLQGASPLFRSSEVRDSLCDDVFCLFSFFFLSFHSYLLFIWILFWNCYSFFFWFSFGCPYEYYQSHLFISQPILAVLNAVQLKSQLIFGGYNGVEARSYQNQNPLAISTNSFDNDFTKNNTIVLTDQLQHTIRFASLSLAAQNIFHDLVIRRIASFFRLIQITKSILG